MNTHSININETKQVTINFLKDELGITISILDFINVQLDVNPEKLISQLHLIQRVLSSLEPNYSALNNYNTEQLLSFFYAIDELKGTSEFSITIKDNGQVLIDSKSSISLNLLMLMSKHDNIKNIMKMFNPQNS